jgi:hypothetical protein
MGKMDLLKGAWTGSVGATTGATWKGIHVLRTKAAPTYSDTPAQQTIRTGFGQLNKFVALFADLLKSQTSLDVRGRSIRNAIISLNKGEVTSGALDPSTLLINKGSLPTPTSFAIGSPAAGNALTATWRAVTGTLISAKSKVFAVVVDQTNLKAFMGSALNSAATMSIPGVFATGEVYEVYFYLIDYRGSSRVGSNSGHVQITIA